LTKKGCLLFGFGSVFVETTQTLHYPWESIERNRSLQRIRHYAVYGVNTVFRLLSRRHWLFFK